MVMTVMGSERIDVPGLIKARCSEVRSCPKHNWDVLSPNLFSIGCVYFPSNDVVFMIFTLEISLSLALSNFRFPLSSMHVLYRSAFYH